MSSSERLLGDFLIEYIQASLPIPAPDTMSLEDTARLIVFAHNLTFFVKCFEARLSKSKKTAIGAEDSVPGLACLLYAAVSKRTDSLALQCEQLEQLLTQVNQIHTVLKTFDIPLENVTFEALTFDTKKNSILQAFSEPSTLLHFSSALTYLIEHLKISMQEPTPVLHPQDLVNVLIESERQLFHDELNQHNTTENQETRIQEIQKELEKPDTSYDEKKDTFHNTALAMQSLVKKNATALSALKTLLIKLLNDSNKTVSSLQLKKTKGNKRYRKINANLEIECKKYLEELMKIDEMCKRHDAADEKSEPFIQAQFTAIQTATQELKKQSENIENLDRTRSNWFLQKLSNWIRKFCESHKKKLPQWDWLHNENAGRLNTLFTTVNQAIPAPGRADTRESISISSNTSAGASALLVQPAPPPVQHSATIDPSPPTQIPQPALHPTAKLHK